MSLLDCDTCQKAIIHPIMNTNQIMQKRSLKSLAQLLLPAILVLCITSRDALAQQGAEEYMGRWSLFLPGGAGWLNVHNDNGYLDAELLWYGGSVLPVSNVYVAEGKLVVTRVGQAKRDDNRTHYITSRYEFEKGMDELVGTAYAPARDGMGETVVHFTGKRLPALPAKPNLSSARFGQPIEIFNGKNLDGWSLIDKSHKNGWKVVDGMLVNDPTQPANDPHHFHYGNLRTDDTFEDFNLKLEVNVPEGSNSGVYLRGIYEIQVVDSYGKDLDPHNMGALYSRVTPAMAAEKQPGEWQAMDITLYKHHVTVKLNGKTILDNVPVEGVTGGAMTADEFSAGPIFPQYCAHADY